MKVMILDYFFEIVGAMFESVENGLIATGVIQGKLKLKRVAKSMFQQATIPT